MCFGLDIYQFPLICNMTYISDILKNHKHGYHYKKKLSKKLER